MKVRHAIVAGMVLVLVVGLLGGCSTNKKPSTTCPPPVAAQPCPAPCPPQTCPPQMYPTPPCPPPLSAGPCCPPAAPFPPAASPYMGSPDAVVVTAPPPPSQPFPAPSAGGAPFAGAPTIESERAARDRMSEELDALENRMDRAERGFTAPAASPSTRMARAAGPGGLEQAQRFASTVQARSAGEVEQRGSVVVIRFSDAFQPGSEQLKKDPRLMTALLTAAQELTHSPGAVIEVVGHSDSTPIKKTRNRWRDNIHLSRERAQTVANALAKNGVPGSRIAVSGRGSAEPLVFPEKTSGDRARNRRVEIHVRF